MGKTNFNRFRWKASSSRQKRWYHKKKLASRGSSIEPELDESMDTSEAESIQISESGNVINGCDWDLSSVSSFGNDERLHISDEEVSPDTSTNDSNENSETCLSDTLHMDLDISKKDSLSLVLAFSCKTSLSRENTEDLLKLIQLHLPKSVSYPKTFFQFQKHLEIPEMKLGTYVYCDEQHIVQHGFCEKCGTNFAEEDLFKRGQQFVVYDIRVQFKAIMNNRVVKEHLTQMVLKRQQMSKPEVEEIYGSKYAELVTDWHLSGTLNTDGVPVFESSRYSIWPVLLTIDELPYLVRKSTIILAALWSGPKKINADLVFSKIVPMLNDLNTNGIFWENSFGDLCQSKFYVLKCSVDAVARALVQGLKQFNGAYGCGHCKEKGRVVPKGRGRCRIFEKVKNLEFRTDAEHRQIASSSQFQFGITSATPLLQLHHFNIIDGVVVEPMHNVFLGVTKSIFNIWFTMKSSDCYLGTPQIMQIINSRVASCKVPTEIVRTVRGLGSIKHWKASEYRTMLFVMTVVTSDLLPKSYHRNFCKLANSIYMLSLPSCPPTEIVSAQRGLRMFVKNVANLYGEEYMSFNIHCLLHLSDFCKHWGPLWQFSAFIFESFNAILLKYIKNANGVTSQVSKKFTYEMQTRYSVHSVFQNDRAKLLFSHLAKIPKPLPKIFCLKGPLKLFQPSDPLTQKCAQFAKPFCIYRTKSAMINGYLFKVKETEKRADCYIKISDTQIGKIKHFLHIECVCNQECTCQKDLIVVDAFRVTKFGYSQFALHCSSTVRMREKVLDLHTVNRDKFFKLKWGESLYFLHVCNLFEID